MEKIGRFELSARFDTRQTFYGKAIVEIEEDNLIIVKKLYSYNTLVALCTLDKLTNKKQFDCFGNYSQTTTRHQKEFFKQMGLNDKEIKELFKNGKLEKGGNYGRNN